MVVTLARSLRARVELGRQRECPCKRTVLHREADPRVDGHTKYLSFVFAAREPKSSGAPRCGSSDARPHARSNTKPRGNPGLEHESSQLPSTRAMHPIRPPRLSLRLYDAPKVIGRSEFQIQRGCDRS